VTTPVDKPAKPHPDFPLFAHNNGKWAKKIKGKLHYFGPWRDPEAALAKYHALIGKPHCSDRSSTREAPEPNPDRPSKPYDDYPLFAHGNGQWAKKIRGRLHYFGTWDDPDGALDLYLQQRDDLQAGRAPTVDSDQWTVKMVVTKFLNSKRRKLESGELSDQMLHDYRVVCDTVLEQFGRNTPVTSLRSADFARLRTHLSESRGPVALKNWIIRVRSIFKFAYAERLISEPMHYGTSFSIPSAKTLRMARNAKPERLFEPEELRLVLEKLDNKKSRNLYTMTLLGINCGFGVTDCALLTFDHLDLEEGWHSFPRPKTGVQRRAKLWPETIRALQRSIEHRKAPLEADDQDKVLITMQGRCYVGKKLNDKNPISQRFSITLKDLGIKHAGLNFGALRHTLQTIGEGAMDTVALQHMMGHAPDNKDMSAIYRECVFQERLIGVSTFVHNWLFPPDQSA
jgi:integrase